MALYRVNPAHIDQLLAEEIAANIRPLPEEIAKLLTWGADEHLLLGCAAATWAVASVRRSPLQPAATHWLLVTMASAALPHVLKLAFDQVRPDRKTVRGHLHGIPISGDAMDAFPSGHALHMGALASAAAPLPRSRRGTSSIDDFGRNRAGLLQRHRLTDSHAIAYRRTASNHFIHCCMARNSPRFARHVLRMN
jgi:hypothetical protein